MGLNLGSAELFFSEPLSLWTVLRSNPSSAKQWISQLQLAVTSRGKYYNFFYYSSLELFGFFVFLSVLWNFFLSHSRLSTFCWPPRSSHFAFESWNPVKFSDRSSCYVMGSIEPKTSKDWEVIFSLNQAGFTSRRPVSPNPLPGSFVVTVAVYNEKKFWMIN